MGTEGKKVIRHRGIFFIWYRRSDGYPEQPGLGWELFEMIPKDRKELDQWADELRARLSAFYDTCAEQLQDLEGYQLEAMLDGEAVVIATTYHIDSFSRAYEIDLDHMLFHYNRHPVYHLDNLPSINILKRSCREAYTTHGTNYDVFWNSTPENYRFDISRLATLAADGANVTPSNCLAGEIVPEPLDILSIRKSLALSRAEDLCLRLTAIYVNRYAYCRRNMLVQEFLFADSHVNIGSQGRAIAHVLATLTLLPVHIMAFRNPGWIRDKPPLPKFRFIRRHICLSLANDLQDERNARWHVSRVVDHIMSTSDTPDMVFGVLFSVFHCIVVRVDKHSDSFTRTAALQFLPEPQSAGCPLDKWVTPGMSLLTRLSHLRAADDIDFFYGQAAHVPECVREWPESNIRFRHRHEDSIKSVMFARHSCPDIRPSPSHRLSRLPNEIFAMIAHEIDCPETLCHFALTSRASMAAAIPRLRFPQVRTQAGFDCSFPSCTVWTHGHILESYDDDGTRTRFNITYRGAPAVLDVSGRMSLKKSEDKLYFSDLCGYMLPRPTFCFGDTFPALETLRWDRLPAPNVVRSQHPSCWRRLGCVPFSSDSPHVAFYYSIKWARETVEELHKLLKTCKASKAGASPIVPRNEDGGSKGDDQADDSEKETTKAPAPAPTAEEEKGGDEDGAIDEEEKESDEDEDVADDDEIQYTTTDEDDDDDGVADDAPTQQSGTRPSKKPETQQQELASATPVPTVGSSEEGTIVGIVSEGDDLCVQTNATSNVESAGARETGSEPAEML